MEPDKDYPGSDIHILSNIATWQHCADLCYQNDQAPALLQFFSLHGILLTKYNIPPKEPNSSFSANCKI